jgi:hypothetical protein
LREFSNLYNNLHFPNFKNVPPCIVIPLKYCEIIRKREEEIKIGEITHDCKDGTKEEMTLTDTKSNKKENENVIDTVRTEYDSQNVLSYQMELPVCTVCLRRLQSTTSGVDGGNDIPVSMWFTGNTDRCQVCKVYGEISESDGTQSQSQTRTGAGIGTGAVTGVRTGVRTGSGTGTDTTTSSSSMETLKSSQVS